MKLIEIHMKFIEFTKITLKIGEAKQKIDMQKFKNSSAHFTLVTQLICVYAPCAPCHMLHAAGISDTAQHTQRRTDCSTLFTSTPIPRVHIGIYIVNKFTKPYHGKMAMHFVFKKKISRRSL